MSVAVGTAALPDAAVVPVAERAPLDVQRLSAAMPQVPAALDADATKMPTTPPPTRMARSLEEVRADLARMREQARARAEQAQAHAQALAQLRAAERVHRDNSFAPTDFMDFGSPGASQSSHADKPLLDDDAFSSSFAATDFQGLGEDQATAPDADFDATAFLPPTALGYRGGAR